MIPLNLAFGNPDLLKQVRLDAVLHGLGGEPQYKNDEQIDNQLRSVLFQIPVPGNPALPGRADAAGSASRASSTSVPSTSSAAATTGCRSTTTCAVRSGWTRSGRSPRSRASRRTASRPTIPRSRATRSTTRTSSTSSQLFDADGNPIELGSEAADGEAVVGVRRTTLAARLKAIYDDTDKLDAFVGMVSERHVPGTEFGELQLAIWKQQFQALRDGDRFFYLNDPDAARHRAAVRGHLPADARSRSSSRTPASTCRTTCSSPWRSDEDSAVGDLLPRPRSGRAEHRVADLRRTVAILEGGAVRRDVRVRRRSRRAGGAARARRCAPSRSRARAATTTARTDGRPPRRGWCGSRSCRRSPAARSAARGRRRASPSSR